MSFLLIPKSESLKKSEEIGPSTFNLSENLFSQRRTWTKLQESKLILAIFVLYTNLMEKNPKILLTYFARILMIHAVLQKVLTLRKVHYKVFFYNVDFAVALISHAQCRYLTTCNVGLMVFSHKMWKNVCITNWKFQVFRTLTCTPLAVVKTKHSPIINHIMYNIGDDSKHEK